MMCNRKNARFVTIFSLVAWATLGCETGTPENPDETMEVTSDWISPPTPVNTIVLQNIASPVGGEIASFTSAITIGVAIDEQRNAPHHPLLLGSLRFQAEGCDVFFSMDPSTEDFEVEASNEADLDVGLFDDHPRGAWLEANPVTPGEHRLVLEGAGPEGWGQEGAGSCAAFADHDGRFTAEIVVNVIEIDQVSVTFPERCRARATPAYFVGDDLSSMTIAPAVDGVPFFAANLPRALPLPVRFTAAEGMVQAPVPARTSSLLDVTLQRDGVVTVEIPTVDRFEIRVLETTAAQSAAGYFVLTGTANLNTVLDGDRFGDDGWGRTRNAIVPLISSVTLDDGTVACSIRTPEVTLRSRSPEICIVEEADDLRDVADQGVFDREEFLWWASRGVYGSMLQDGLCALTLESSQAGFSQDLDVTIVNVAQLIDPDLL